MVALHPARPARRGRDAVGQLRNRQEHLGVNAELGTRLVKQHIPAVRGPGHADELLPPSVRRGFDRPDGLRDLFLGRLFLASGKARGCPSRRVDHVTGEDERTDPIRALIFGLTEHLEGGGDILGEDAQVAEHLDLFLNRAAVAGAQQGAHRRLVRAGDPLRFAAGEEPEVSRAHLDPDVGVASAAGLRAGRVDGGPHGAGERGDLGRQPLEFPVRLGVGVEPVPPVIRIAAGEFEGDLGQREGVQA